MLHISTSFPLHMLFAHQRAINEVRAFRLLCITLSVRIRKIKNLFKNTNASIAHTNKFLDLNYQPMALSSTITPSFHHSLVEL